MKKRLLAGLMAGALMLGGAAFAEKHFTVNVPTSKRVQEALEALEALASPDQDDGVESDDVSTSAAVDENPVSAGVDLSGMSYEELVELNGAVMNAIADSEGFVGFKVGGGTFYAGKDFPVGRYRIDPLEGSFTNYRVYDEKGEKLLGGFIDYDDGIYLGAVEFLEGYSFENDRGAHFSPSAGVEFD